MSEKKKKEEKKVEELHKELLQKLEEIRKARNFKCTEWINKKCEMFNKYMKESGLSACCVSLSGGIDSAVTLGLMLKSSKMKDSPIKKVLAISQPIHSSEWAYNRAHECAKKLGASIITVDSTKIYDQLKSLVDKQVGTILKDEKFEGNQFSSGQLRSYMRTPVGYYVAQLLSQSGTPCLVMGTGNKDEDVYLAYFCKAGDGVVDVQLIADIHKSEVFKVGKELGVPESILNAKPSADLWGGQTDEEELGFTYDFIELWINYLNMDEKAQKKLTEGLGKDALKQFNEWSEKAKAVHKRNKHKINSPVNLNIDFPMK